MIFRALSLCMMLFLANARAEPALWLAQGPAAKVYLFGTMHILPAKADWLTPKIAAALKNSDVLWEEADVGQGGTVDTGSFMDRAIDPHYDLLSHLSAADLAAFRKMLAACHMPLTIAAHFRPWFATMLPTLCGALAQSKGGFSAADGPEAVLVRRARSLGKPVRYFETAQEQLALLQNDPDPVQIARLHEELRSSAVDGSDFAAMEQKWLAGDVAALAPMLDDMRHTEADFYRKVISDRNARFTKRIGTMLAGHGTVFVAIGAGHFVGRDSVITMLQVHGFTVTRQ